MIIPKCPGQVEFGLEKSIKVGRSNHRTEETAENDGAAVVSVIGDCGDDRLVGAFHEVCRRDEDCVRIYGGEFCDGVLPVVHLGDGRASMKLRKQRGEEFRGIWLLADGDDKDRRFGVVIGGHG